MKLDLILENVRNKYTLGLLEESTTSGVSESDTLKGKIFINESTMMLRSILLEENVMGNIQSVLAAEYSRLFEENIFDDAVDYWNMSSDERQIHNANNQINSAQDNASEAIEKAKANALQNKINADKALEAHKQNAINAQKSLDEINAKYGAPQQPTVAPVAPATPVAPVAAQTVKAPIIIGNTDDKMYTNMAGAGLVGLGAGIAGHAYVNDKVRTQNRNQALA